MALLYNDISVLENHHCALAFEIFNSPKSNVFEEVPKVLRKSIRKSIIEMILSTDMSTHFVLIDQLNDCVGRVFVPLSTANAINNVVLHDKDRSIMLRSILHAADISNPSKAWDIAKKWSDLVIEEFYNQGDLEKEESLPLSMNTDRSESFQDEISLNFNDYMVAPFFLSLLKALPKLEKAVRVLEANRYEWDSIMRNRITKTISINEKRKINILSKWTEKESDFLIKVKTELEIADRKLINVES